MKFKRTEKALNKFALKTMTFARGNLLRQKKNASGALRDSIDYNITTTRKGENISSFRLQFTLADYGTFVEDGVNGTRKKYGSPYSYTTKQPPSSVILGWLKSKPVKLRDSKGRFRKNKKGELNTLAFLIARKIKERGLKPAPFLKPSFEKVFKGLDKEIVKDFALDMEEFYAFTIQEEIDKR